jgi:hypothetical protein
MLCVCMPAVYLPLRKSCVTCGCSRDHHRSLNESDFPYLKDLALNSLSLDDKKQANTKYAWYPSGIDSNLVGVTLRLP